MQDTRVCLCGPLRVELDGVSVTEELPARQGRLLFAYLVLTRRRASRRDELVEAIWGEHAPEDAGGALAAVLSRLRRVVGAQRLPVGALVQLRLGERAEVDVDAALAAPNAARRALDDRRPEQALAVAAEALAILEQPLLAEFEREWIDERRRELGDLFAPLVELAAEAALRIGGAALQRAELLTRRGVERERFREPVHAALMRVLAARGDTAAALGVYDDLRTRLRDELGTSPSRALSEVHRQLLLADAETERPIVKLPPALHADRGALVGRAAVLEALARRYALAAAGDRQIVVLEGEAGIGKTRVASEAGRRFHARGASVLYGRANPEALVAYEPLIGALEHFLAGRDDVPADLELDLGELSRVLPFLGHHVRAPARADPGAERYALFQSVSRVLRFAARGRPLVTILDDLHWADASTVLALRHLAHDLVGAPVLMLMTCRESDIRPADGLRDLFAHLGPDPGFEWIALAGLDVRETRALVDAQGLRDAPDAFVRSLADRTQGNPFFLVELLRALDGSLVEETALPVPPSVDALIRHRLAGLGDEASRLLAVAAIVGPDFGLDVLARVSGHPVERTLEALEVALQAGFVRELPDHVDHFAFSHELVRQALYEMQTASRRARAHRRVGETLEADRAGSRATSAQVAHHFWAAAALDNDPRAAHYCAVAAEEALGSLSYEEAAAHCQRGLQVLRDDDPGVRGRLLLIRADALMRAGDRAARDACSAAVAHAREHGDGTLLARAVLVACGPGVSIVGVDTDLAAGLQDALDALADRDASLRAQLLARLAIAVLHRPDAPSTAKLSADALAEARRSHDDGALLGALSARHVALWHPDGLTERIRVADEMVELAAATGHTAAELQGRNWRCVDAWEAGDLLRFDAEAARHQELSERLRLPAFQWYGPLWRAARALLEGRRREAVELSEIAVQAARRAEASTGDEERILLRATLDAQVGAFGDDLIAEEEARMRSPGLLPEHAALYAVGCCAMYATNGRFGEAQALLDDLAENRFAVVGRHPQTLMALFALAEAATLLADASRASQLHELLLPYAGRRVLAGRAVADVGSVHFALARTAPRAADAIRSFEAAIAEDTRLNARPWLVRDRVRYAELLSALGRQQRAQAVAASAVAEAHRLELDAAVSAPVIELARSAGDARSLPPGAAGR